MLSMLPHPPSLNKSALRQALLLSRWLLISAASRSASGGIDPASAGGELPKLEVRPPTSRP